MQPEIDLFGNIIIKDVLLRDRFIEPPFSVIDTKSGHWQNRKREWLKKGIKSEQGRTARAFNNKEWMEDVKKTNINNTDTSIFDPALTELMYEWFCPKGGYILDPFAGGSVRGIVAHYLGFNYLGIELREEQVYSNNQQAKEILNNLSTPVYICGDSDEELNKDFNKDFDLIFSCPPYVDLEVYSDLPEDLSTMQYPEFLSKYRSIIKKSLTKLKKDCYAVFVVGEVRDKKGFYYDFVGDTKKAFIECGARLYNDAVLLNSVGSASMRTRQFEVSKKLVKTHQNILVFKK